MLTQEEFTDAVAPMTTAELDKLLKSTDYNEMWEWDPKAKNVISDSDLERLLDRSSLLASAPGVSEISDESQ